MSKANKHVITIVTEGQTDEIFYKKIIEILRKKADKQVLLNVKLDYICVTGIGRFESKLYRDFQNHLKQYPKDATIHVFLCYDADVFKGKKNPPVNWQKVEKCFMKDKPITYTIS